MWCSKFSVGSSTITLIVELTTKWIICTYVDSAVVVKYDRRLANSAYTCVYLSIATWLLLVN